MKTPAFVVTSPFKHGGKFRVPGETILLSKEELADPVLRSLIRPATRSEARSALLAGKQGDLDRAQAQLGAARSTRAGSEARRKGAVEELARIDTELAKSAELITKLEQGAKRQELELADLAREVELDLDAQEQEDALA